MSATRRQYAAGTGVSIEKSKAEIDALLGKHGASQRCVLHDEENLVAVVVFSISGRRYRIDVWRPSEYHPSGDPGPGRFARVARVDRKGHVHYHWTKERRGGEGPPVGRAYACNVRRVLNVDAYQAPLLLSAEEYKAGKFGTVPPIAEAPKPAPRRRRPDGSSQHAHRKMLRGFLGAAVRLRRDITTRGGAKYEKGSLWRVTHWYRGEFTIDSIDASGSLEEPMSEARTIRCVSHRDFYVESSVPSDPKYEYKKPKRERPPTVDDLDPED